MKAADLIDGKYEVIRLLGEGGMGAVYEARNTGTGRRVAVKVIHSEYSANPGIVARFQREARAVGSIETQHIAHVLDTGLDGVTSRPYMVIEFLQGEDLQECLTRGPLDPLAALRVIAQASAGLQKAHEAGVVHRDIKPANIFLAEQEEGARVVKLLDFGIAKVKGEPAFTLESAALTRTGTMLGSPLYMSPEQARTAKTVDHRTDLWSLGAVLYELLAGSSPFAHCESFGELILSISSTPARSIREVAPWVSAEIAAIVHRSLEIDPTRRYASASELSLSLRALLPDGHALHESMLTSVARESVTEAAPYLPSQSGGVPVVVSGVGGSGVRVVAASSSPGAASAPASSSTEGPESRTEAAPFIESTGSTGASAPIIAHVAAAAAAAITGPSRLSSVPREGDAVSASTSSGLTHTRPGDAGRTWSSIGTGIGAGVFMVALVAGGLVLFPRMRHTVGLEANAASAIAIAPSVPVAPLAQVAGAASVAAPLVRTVVLSITPDTASVEVDGVATSVADGMVALSGTLGSVRRVRVFVGNAETVSPVVISESGAVPPKLTVAVKAPPPARAEAKAPARALVEGASRRPESAAAPAPPPRPKPESAAVDHVFQ